MLSHSRISRLVAAGFIATSAFLFSSSTPAQAAGTEVPVIRKVDTTSFPHVELTVLRPSASPIDAAVNVSENDSPVSNPTVRSLADAGKPVGVVLVIDTSEMMTRGDAITKAKAAAIEMVKAKKPNERYAVIAFNGTSRPVVNFTQDQNLLIAGIDGLRSSSDSALWKGISLASSLYNEDSASDFQSNIVVISGSPDLASGEGSYANANSSIRGSHSLLFSVFVNQRGDIDGTDLKALSNNSGGRSIEITDPETLPQALLGIGQNISNQVVVEYESTHKGELNIGVKIGTEVAIARSTPGTVSEGAEVSPEVTDNSKIPGVLTGPLAPYLVAFGSLAGVLMLLYGVIEIVGNERNQLSRVLRPYADDSPDGEKDVSKLADSEIIKKAVASTARLASNRGLLQVVQSRLEQADLPLRPAEALFFTSVIALIAMLVGAVFFGILGLAAAGLIFAYFPMFITGFLAKRRRKKFTSQLPDALQLLAGSLRAGYSLLQGLDAISKQCPAPINIELQRAMSEARLGRPVEDALQDVSNRMGSDDFEWTVMAIKIQREVGGNLAELLVTVAETMVSRERLRREVRALTAEGRMSAYILCVLPFAVGGIIAVLNPGYMEPMFHNIMGQIALAAAGILILVGYAVMNKMIEIEA